MCRCLKSLDNGLAAQSQQQPDLWTTQRQHVSSTALKAEQRKATVFDSDGAKCNSHLQTLQRLADIKVC